MKKTSKLLILLALVCTLVVCCVVSASAVVYETEGYYTYTITNNKARITDVDTSISGEVVIPDTLGGAPVTEIGDNAFRNTNITSLTMPNSVVEIEKYAFYDCKNLTSVTISDSVLTIGEYAFENCENLANVYITDLSGWCNISFSTFSNPLHKGANLYLNGDLLTELVIPDDITQINDFAFTNCKSLKSVFIHDNVTEIGDNAFYECENLENLELGNGVKLIYTSAFFCCLNLKKLVIPDSVIYIGNSAFQVCGLESLTIGSGLTTINGFVFSYCKSLSELVIPDNITTICEGAFCNNTGLKSISIGSGLKYVSRSAFDFGYGGRPLEDIYIKNLKNWCEMPADCGLHSAWSDNATLYLNGEPIKNLVIPEGTTHISDFAFYGFDQIETITIPDSITTIGYNTFAKCTSLTNFKIPDSVVSIDSNAFADCTAITSIEIPDSVTTLGSSAFSGCTKLETVIIGDGIKTIEEYTFYGCSNIKYLTIGDSVESVGQSNFDGYAFDCAFTHIILGDSLKNFEGFDFSAYDNLVYVEIGDSITNIPETEFAWIESLETVKLGQGIKRIYKRAFLGCDNLKSITIPDNVKSIEFMAFSDCPSLKSVTLGKGNTRIDTNAFSPDNNIEEVHITNLRNYCITDYIYTAGGTAEINHLFSAGAKLYIDGNPISDLIIPDGVERLGDITFGDCTTLKSITIPDSVTSIGYRALPRNIKIHFEGSREKWNSFGVDWIDAENVYCYNGPAEEHIHNYDIIKNGSNWPNRCTQTWTEKQQCACGDYKIVEKAAVGHSEEVDKAVPVTCTTSGLTEGKHCSVCYIVLASQKRIPATGHSYNKYISNNNATCTADGTKTANCNNGCGSKNTITDTGTKKPHQIGTGGHCANCNYVCSHSCHKDGIQGFFYKFSLFFWKLFKTNKTCACGMYHY